MDTQALDDFSDDGSVVAHRARARDLLPEISRQAKEAVSKQGIGIGLDLFFVIPSNSIIMFGTTLDPDDAEWAVVAEIVSSVVQRLLGLAGTRCQPVMYATTQDQESHDERVPTEPDRPHHGEMPLEPD